MLTYATLPSPVPRGPPRSLWAAEVEMKAQVGSLRGAEAEAFGAAAHRGQGAGRGRGRGGGGPRHRASEDPVASSSTAEAITPNNLGPGHLPEYEKKKIL